MPSVRLPGADTEKMRTVTNPARLLFNGPIPPLGPLFHMWLAGGLVLLCLGVAVLPAMETLRSPLTVFAALLNSQQSTSTESELAGLVRVTRERRTLVARHLHGAPQPSEELARLQAERQGALNRLMNMADTAAMAKSDLQSLNADWARLEQATVDPRIDASVLFALHSQLIDKQLALLSSLESPSS